MRGNRDKCIKKTVSWRNSMFTRVFLLIMLLIVFEVFCYVGISAAFLEKYYIRQKKDILIKTYQSIAQIYSDGGIDENERAIKLEKLSNDYNLQVMVFSGSDGLLFSSVPTDAVRFGDDGVDREEKHKPPREPINNSVERNVLAESENYIILSTYISEIDARSIEFRGELTNGIRIMLRTSMASISEGVKIANRFLIISGTIASIFAVIIGILISIKATKNIKSLSEVSNRMAELDFSVKYRGSGRDEISVLGESLNTLSFKLERAISELKKANIELTKDIDQKEKIDRQRKEFLSNVSHELKTPISIIEAYAEGLNEMELDEDGRKFYTDVILDESKKMEMIIQKLMSLMKIESGAESLNIERYNIAEQIEHILGQKKILFEQSGVFAEFSCEKPVFVWADEFLIEEAFVNFLVNAVKYSSGEKKIRIFLEEKEKHVRLCVYNTGSSISEEEMKNIWKSFYVVDKARTRESGGCGLGLSIVAAIAEANGQEYGVYNTEGGVVFWFEVDRG